MVRQPAGGIAALRRFLVEHDDVEFDLWSLYRVDVSDAMAGRLSVRRVMALVERLQDEPWSRYRAKQLGGENWRDFLGWGPAEYLHAALIDAVQVNSAITAVHGSKSRPRTPPRFFRPGDGNELEAATIADLDEIPAAFNAMNDQ